MHIGCLSVRPPLFCFNHKSNNFWLTFQHCLYSYHSLCKPSELMEFAILICYIYIQICSSFFALCIQEASRRAIPTKVIMKFIRVISRKKMKNSLTKMETKPTMKAKVTFLFSIHQSFPNIFHCERKAS